MIEIKGLHKYYNRSRQNEVHAVNGIDLSLPERGIIALFGKSGCGKTTLLNLVGGLDYSSGGEVLIDGERITPDNDKMRNADIGYIFQNYNLSKKMTVEDNVATALMLIGVTDEDVVRERVEMALTCVDMQKYKKRYPDSLSGGQQQRVAIARAIVKSPKIILADEPTGNLDEQNTVMVMNLLKSISRTCPVLLVTHESELVDLYCDRVIEIQDGSVISDRTNDSTDGYVKKRSNEVYLGDMESSAATDGEHTVEFFGEGIPEKIRLISSGGTLYLSVPDGVRAKIADKTSELIIHEGRQASVDTAKITDTDISALGNIDGKVYGRLYGFFESFKHAFVSNFIKPRLGRKTLIAGLVLFSFTIVILVSMMGTVFTGKAEMEESYNKNTVYLDISVGGEYVRSLEERFDVRAVSVFRHNTYSSTLPNIVSSHGFDTAYFETFEGLNHYSELQISAMQLPIDATDNVRVIAGRCTDLADDEIVITRRMADCMLEKTTISFIDSYSKLLSAVNKGNVNYKVVGIIEGSDSIIYMSRAQYEERIFNSRLSPYLSLDICENIMPDWTPPKAGEIYVSSDYLYNSDYVKLGNVITVLGKEFTISRIFDSREVQYYTLGLISREDIDELIYPISTKTDSELNISPVHSMPTHYAIYTSEPDAVAAAVRADKVEDNAVLTTPTDLYNQFANNRDLGFKRLILSVVVLGGVMCLCLYMIMRAMLLTEIKDIGISRAIGASKRNILFRFFTESLVIFTLTVFVGYLLGVAFISYMTASAPNVITVFNLTPALAILTLLGLFSVSILCGILPVIGLLRKSSAEILSKYDI